MTIFSGTLTATDGSGQTAQATVSINQVSKLAVSVSVSPTQGPPGTLYTITASASGGVSPYSFTISPINGVQPAPTSTPGVFTVTI